MTYNNPNARDSFVGDVTPNDGVNNPVPASGLFNIETNPVTNPPAPNGDNTGCWCSESSVWSILWDLFDTGADANDTLALGFQPIWDVLVGPQRITPAFTTVFSFVSALKAARPGDTAAINTLVAAQNIDAATIEPFASTETHVPANVPANAALPVYTTATIGGGPVVLRSVDDAAATPETLGNKLGNRRFVRFTVASTRSITVTLTSSNPDPAKDPDFVVWRAGDPVAFGLDPPQAAQTATFNASAGTYLIEAYDCANGCNPQEGTPGDYDLTVTIN
jgi:hypothetical protein